jgi:Transposase DDE domain group 1
LRNETITQCVLFPELFDKPLAVQFDQSHTSSDGGAVLLKAADQRLELTASLAACLRDRRQAHKVDHELIELLRQRVYGLACGYADGNDAARLAQDPVYQLLLDRDPVQGEALASQPTLSRFENGVGCQTLFRLGERLAQAVIERHRRRCHGRARRITIDLDPTDDPTHGAQQLSLFNGHYDTWCYLPLLGFVQFDDEAEQYLVAALLRPGNATPQQGALGLLARLVACLRKAFPKARLRVRLDGGFASPELLDWLEAEQLEYVVGLAKNAVLKRRANRLMRQARCRSRCSGRTEHLYGECRYAAKSWAGPRRVIIKAEVVCHPDRAPKDNPRFLVTNLAGSPRQVYESVYCQRGEIENRIKELHELEIGRTSCSRFWANQFRLLLTAAAYVLLQELRLRAARTGCARAQVATLRLRLLKLAASVQASVRRLVFHLPSSFPYFQDWRRVALALGARTG